MEDSNKIWYEWDNNGRLYRDENIRKPFRSLPGVSLITKYTFCSYKNTIQASIDNFNRSVEWENMWDIKEAEDRLEKGHLLFIGVDKEGPLAHVWFDDNYLYNMFADPRRPDGYSVDFVKHCMQFILHKNVKLYCDDWNIKAQKFFEKVGFERNI